MCDKLGGSDHFSMAILGGRFSVSGSLNSLCENGERNECLKRCEVEKVILTGNKPTITSLRIRYM